MSKEVIVTALGNRIEYATTDGKGMITGKREDITEQAKQAAFAYYKTEFERKNKNGKGMGTTYGEHGSLFYLAPGTKIVREEEVNLSKEMIVKELEERINDSKKIDDHEVAVELENFLGWYLEELS